MDSVQGIAMYADSGRRPRLRDQLGSHTSASLQLWRRRSADIGSAILFGSTGCAPCNAGGQVSVILSLHVTIKIAGSGGKGFAKVQSLMASNR